MLVGHSVGAIIGILAANRWPAAFRKLILIGPSPCFLNDGSYLGGFETADLETLLAALDANYRHWAREMAPLIMGHPERPELAWELESSFTRLDPAVAKQFARLSFGSDHRDELPLLTTPTAILQCAEDNIAPEVVGEFMRETIPDSMLVTLAATGHCPQLSAPGEVAQALRELLDGSWSETEPAELDTQV